MGTFSTVLPSTVIFGYVMAVLTPLMVGILKNSSGRILCLAPALLFFIFALAIPQLSQGGSIDSYWQWGEVIGLPLALRLDGLSLLFCLLITGFGCLVTLYAGEYLKGHPQLSPFFVLLLFFMASMLGAMVSDHLILLFAFWELTSLGSFLLIGFYHKNANARQAALQSLVVTAMGGLFMLAGFILIGNEAGTFRLSQLAEHRQLLIDSDLMPAMLGLILMGAFTKSAQFPFHFWLPAAMNAPTPVSAYLHSATMVKLGIYLLARLVPVFGGTDLWFYLVTGAGAITMLLASLQALAQTDLKLLLAYMTVMALGALTMLLGIGSPFALKAALVFLVVHSLYKGGLFLIVGIIDHNTHQRDVLKLANLAKSMPLLAAVTAVAALSMGGMPPLLGFVGKELVYLAAMHTGAIATKLLIGISVFAKASATTVALIIALKPFFNKLSTDTQEFEPGPYHVPWEMITGPLLLASFGLLLGLWPDILGIYLVGPALQNLTGFEVDLELHSWPDLSVATFLSIDSLLTGAIMYYFWHRLRPKLQRLIQKLYKWGPTSDTNRSLALMLKVAHWQTLHLQSATLRVYLSVIFFLVTVGILAFILPLPLPEHMPNWNSVAFYEWTLAALILSSSIFACITRTMLGCFVAMGVMGYSVTLFYILYSAPDLALTQALVETLTLVFAALIISKMPGFHTVSDAKLGNHLRDLVIASCFGLSMGGLLLLSLQQPFDPYLGNYFNQFSLAKGFGRNVVNVIIVDFRSLDTLGEITVIAVAALCIHSLFKLKTRSSE